jgi:hypothetical protein
MVKFFFVKYGKLHCYTYQLVDSEFELMSTEQVNKKFAFSNNNIQSTSQTKPRVNSTPIAMSNPTSNSASTHFSIPIEDLRLDSELVKAHEFVEKARDEAELSDFREKLKRAESIAENQAILEINLDHKLLEQNVEILVYSKFMSKTIFDKLMVNILPIYIYGIIQDKLSDEVGFFFCCKILEKYTF